MENRKFCGKNYSVSCTRSIFFPLPLSFRCVSCLRTVAGDKLVRHVSHLLEYIVSRHVAILVEFFAFPSDENFSKINISIEIDNSCRYQTIMDRSFFFIQARFVLEKKKKKESYVSTILIKLEQFTWRPCKCIPALYPRLAVQSMVQIRGNYYAFRDSG